MSSTGAGGTSSCPATNVLEQTPLLRITLASHSDSAVSFELLGDVPGNASEYQWIHLSRRQPPETPLTYPPEQQHGQWLRRNDGKNITSG